MRSNKYEIDNTSLYMDVDSIKSESIIHKIEDLTIQTTNKDKEEQSYDRKSSLFNNEYLNQFDNISQSQSKLTTSKFYFDDFKSVKSTSSSKETRARWVKKESKISIISNSKQKESINQKEIDFDDLILKQDDIIYENSIKIVKQIGRGGQGIVYVGTIIDEEIEEDNKYVAIKRYILTSLKKDDLGKIVTEYESLKNLDNGFIIKYYDIEVIQDIDKSIIHIIMEYIDGINLKEYIQLFEGKCTLENIKVIGRCILEGLNYLHSNGIIHRDLKPENILIAYNMNEIKIVDFGISTQVKEREGTHIIKKRTSIGTPWYMSPEIISEKPYGYDTDIWSFGCIIFELASGVKPFNDLNYMSAMIKMTEYSSPIEYASEDIKDILYDKKNRSMLDLLQKCFRPNNLYRPTASELIEHQFFKD